MPAVSGGKDTAQEKPSPAITPVNGTGETLSCNKACQEKFFALA